jgi:hypothetical protein
MGPYCNYCDKRCFVDNPKKPGWLLATCIKGQAHDKDVLGYCWRDIKEEREQEEAEPPQPKIPGFRTIEYKDWEITGPYVYPDGTETFLVFPAGAQNSVYEAPTPTVCLNWIDEEGSAA